MGRVRLDKLLTERGLAKNIGKARRLIMAGQVLVAGRVLDKVATPVDADAEISVRRGLPFVSRGGLKLDKALAAFEIDVANSVAADVGASTGGFTDCLLQRGAARVYAIDVGYGQLAWQLRQSERVIVMERTNARHIKSLPEPIDLVAVDASFISLKLLLPPIRRWLKPAGQVVALIKPQFEAREDQVGEGGVIRERAIHRTVLVDLLTWTHNQGWHTLGLIRSPVKGPKGNIEFLVWLAPDQEHAQDQNKELIAQALETKHCVDI